MNRGEPPFRSATALLHRTTRPDIILLNYGTGGILVPINTTNTAAYAATAPSTSWPFKLRAPSARTRVNSTVATDEVTRLVVKVRCNDMSSMGPITAAPPSAPIQMRSEKACFRILASRMSLFNSRRLRPELGSFNISFPRKSYCGFRNLNIRRMMLEVLLSFSEFDSTASCDKVS